MPILQNGADQDEPGCAVGQTRSAPRTGDITFLTPSHPFVSREASALAFALAHGVPHH